ncbi:TPA: hypothetical protein I4G69_004365 [Enterobacter asburiae]|nr:hypothetical protein [Enterobacter asburiae]
MARREESLSVGFFVEEFGADVEILKIALASLEAEPVCVIDQSNLDYLKSGSDADVWPASRTEMGDVLLYRTAPPAPVSVPDAIHSQGEKSVGDDYYALGWNACRAAMLQSSGINEQLNSPVIPDDVQRMDWLVSKTVNVREPLVYGSHNILWSQAITDEQDDHHATKLREQIDAAMEAENAAAPQQEVK